MMRMYDDEVKSQSTEAPHQDVPEPTVRSLVDFQTELLTQLDDAVGMFSVHLEPIMREDPRGKVDPTAKRAGQPLLAELIDTNNWRIEKLIGDLKAMQRLSAL